MRVTRGRVDWLFDAERTSGQPLDDALHELLVASPARARLWSRQVVVALSSEYAQTKRLRGLPATTNHGLLQDVVRQNASRFFVVPDAPPRIGHLAVVGPGDAWSTAYDEGVIRDVRRTCDRLGFRVHTIVPSVAVLPYVFQCPRVCWPDGGRDVVADYDDDRRVERVRRVDSIGEAAPRNDALRAMDLVPVDGLRIAGPEAWRYAAAYGAVVAGPCVSTRLDVERTEGEPRRSRRRLAIAGTALILSLVGLALAPGVRAVREAKRTTESLHRLEAQQRAIAAAHARLVQADRALEELAHFDAGRRPMLPLLTAVSQHLPDGGAILAITLDTVGGTMVLIAPRAAPAIAALETVPGLASPELVGPVTHELTAAPIGTPALGQSPELERVTVRFRRIASSVGRSR
ncbi:MAG TPA: hypothetical protein VGG78_00810 [Gemmatimonadaceae bacterium]